VLKGFKNFLMRGNVVEAAVAFVVALAFSALITSFISFIIDPLLAATVSGKKLGLGWVLRPGNSKTFVDVGSLIGAFISFIVFMLVVYFAIVVPYKSIQKRRGQDAFGDPAPVRTCPECLSDGLPEAATKCKFCASPLPPLTAATS
jgi:large conductance mechanosensitive channel